MLMTQTLHPVQSLFVIQEVHSNMWIEDFRSLYILIVTH